MCRRLTAVTQLSCFVLFLCCPGLENLEVDAGRSKAFSQDSYSVLGEVKSRCTLYKSKSVVEFDDVGLRGPRTMAEVRFKNKNVRS